LQSFTPATTPPRIVAADDRAIRALAGGPALLFIHGTNSLTHSGFARLDNGFIQRVHERYGGRVFAFDHPTLSVDPAQNCRKLADMLPPDAGLVVDILAHSRGGLVARMLAERANGRIDAAALQSARSCSWLRRTTARHWPTRNDSAGSLTG
jgi:pimeloyl-ACP methyl ester carboxylesterase